MPQVLIIGPQNTGLMAHGILRDFANQTETTNQPSQHHIFHIVRDPCCDDRIATADFAIGTVQEYPGLSRSTSLIGSRTLFIAVYQVVWISPLPGSFGRTGRRATKTHACFELCRRISFLIFPILIYTGHAALSPERLVRCVFSDLKSSGTMVPPSETLS